MAKELIKRICKTLNENKIPYMINGGQAVLKYGEPRFTQDIDFTIGLEPKDAQIFINIQEKLDVIFTVDSPQDFLNETFVLPAKDRQTSFRLDFVFILTEFEKEAIKKSVKVDLDGININFISIEDLLIQKLIASRPRDIEDVRGILLKNKDFNVQYIEKWLKLFDFELELYTWDTFNEILKSVNKSLNTKI